MGQENDSRGHSRQGKLAVIGAGAWGTVLAAIQADNHARVMLFSPEHEAVEEINRFHTNSRYTGELRLEANVIASGSLERSLEGASRVLVAVPSHAAREAAAAVAAGAGKGVPTVLATKGLEQGTGMFSIEIWRRELAARSSGRRKSPDPLVLSGPNLALEIAAGKPAVSTLAGQDAAQVADAADALAHPLLSLVPYHDPLAAQVAGALKNVYAVACGMGSALGWGDNAMGAIVYRGLAETAAFATALGADPGVVCTPAGAGDFLATCMSPLSRNHDLGRAIAGAAGAEDVRGVREGALTACEALRRGRALGVEMRLLEATWSVMSGASSAAAVLQAACGAPHRAAVPQVPERAGAMAAGMRLARGLGVAAE